MIIIHILAFLIGALPVWASATGRLRGSSVNRVTGEESVGGIPDMLPGIAGLIVMASALLAMLQ